MKLMQKQAQITIFFDSFVSLVNQVEPKGLLADIYEIYYDFLLFFSNLSIFHEFTKVFTTANYCQSQLYFYFWDF